MQRLLPIQHTGNLTPLQPVSVRGEVAIGQASLPVLPPITSPGGNRAGILPPIGTSESPPAYQEMTNSPSLSPSGLPNYNTVERREREAIARQESFQPPDLAQYMSNEEIHVAAMEGVSNSQMKSLALQYGVDFRDHGGRTPLMYTVIGNQPKMCATLIKLKAAVNTQDSSGMSPLLWATYLAKPDIIRVLLR